MKRFLSFVIVLFMVCTIVPACVSAATNSDYPPYANVEFGYSSDVNCGTVRYISQQPNRSSYFYDAYWGSWKSSATGECCTASISMALSYVGINKTPNDILTAHNGLTVFYGWGVNYETPSIETGMDRYVSGSGKWSPLIIHLNNYPGASKEWGHWVVVIGKVSSNVYQIADPSSDTLWNMTINGNSASYMSRSDNIDLIYQYYNPNAVIDNEFPSIVDNSVNVGEALYNGGNWNGFVVTFKATDNIKVDSVYAKVWKYGDAEPADEEDNRIKGSVNINKDGSYSCKILIDCNKFGVADNQGAFNYKFYVSDGYNVMEYKSSIQNEAATFNFFRISPDSATTATYKVVPDSIAVRCAPYEKWNDTNTELYRVEKGTQISIVGAYVNDKHHLWYQTEEGTWVYSEYLKQVMPWTKLRSLLQKHEGKVCYYTNGQVIKSGVTLSKTAAPEAKLTNALRSNPLLLTATLGATNDAYATYYVTGREYSSGGGAHTYPATYYTVNFNANGGSCSYSSRSYIAGSAFGYLPTPSRFGYSFDGWFTEPDGGTQVTGSTICNSNGVTYYAHWTRIILLQGSCGDSMNFILYYDGELDITGSGEMTSHPWTKDYAERVLFTKMEGSITTIADSAFNGCKYMTECNIPDTVTEIGAYAFYNCISLIDATLPDILSKIDGHSFENCSQLTYICIPTSVKIIDECAFRNCNSLIQIEFNVNSGIKLCNQCFANCTSLNNIEIPKNVQTGFYTGCDGCYGPFYGCSALSDVSFANGILSIPDGLFFGCTGLRDIVIPNTITVISEYAFRDCVNLEYVYLPHNTGLQLCNKAFLSCTSLNNIEIPKTVQTGFYTGCDGCEGPFCGCSSMKNVTLEDGMISIPDGLFFGCSGLREIDIPDSVTIIHDYAFRDCNLERVRLPQNADLTLCEKSFLSCKSLDSIFVPKNISTTGSPFYGCSSLKKIVLEDGTTSIPDKLFYGCTGLVEFTIPDTVTSLGTYVFADCTSLENVFLPAGRQNITTGLFKNCSSLKEIEFPDSVIAIRSSAFEGCTSLENVALPSGLQIIEGSAFRNCDSLKEIIIPGGVSTIGSGALRSCDSLQKVIVSSGVKIIESTAFAANMSLTEVRLPNSITSIGESAFNACDVLTNIQIPDSVKSIGRGIFAYCDKLKNVSLGTGITTIPEYAFYECFELESITLPYRTTAVDSKAFGNCTKLASVTVPRSVTSIASDAISYRDKTTIYGVAGTYAETWAKDNSFKFVDKQVKATNVILGSTELQLNKNATAKLTMTVTPADFTDEVTWKSADTSIATVADDGTVKAVGVGTTTIKLTVGDVSASCKVTVVQPVTSVSLNKTSLSMEALGTYQLTATANPSNVYDKTIKWSSSDPAVATVDENGLVTAIGKGSATITATATAVSGVSRSCTVTVTNNGVQAKSVDELESPHNYTSNCSDIWLYTLPGAASISVSFDARTSMEDGFDYLYLYDAAGKQIGKYTGTELAGKTVDIEGNTVKIKLVSDNGGNDWGFKVTAVTEKAIHTHSYTAVVTKPTCTEKGYTTYICACGESYVDNYVNALGHSFGVWTQTKAPTCTVKGTETRYCSGCDKTETREVAALGHDFGVWSAQVEATCTEAGTDIRFCSRCDAIETRGVKALGHDYKDGKCTRCGAADPDYKVSAPKISGSIASSGKPSLKWDAVDGAAKYEIYRATSKSGTYSKMYTTASTSYTNTGAKAGTTYYYKVLSLAADGTASDFSNIVKLTATLAKPAPTISTVASSGKIKLTWAAVDGAKQYEIWRATSKTGTYSKMYTTSSTSYTNTSAKAGTTYYYKVKALGSTTAANSAFSNIKYMTCDCAQPVAKISTVASSGKIKLTWAAVEGATKYEIWRATSKTGTYSKMYTTSSTSYTNTSAKAGTTYYYKVKALGKTTASDSAFSNINYITCDCAQPVVKITTSSGHPKLTWSKVDGATKYEIYRATSKTGTYTKMTTVTGTSYTNTSAKAGTTYYYKVMAIGSKSAANSAYSTVVSIKAK